MRLLLDTHVLLWSSATPEKISSRGRDLIADRENEIWFSAVSVWEIVIKRGLGRSDFDYEPRVTRKLLLDNGFRELPVKGEHALALDSLPNLHKDPFDRIMIAQAMCEAMMFVTSDEAVARYPGLILKV